MSEPLPTGRELDVLILKAVFGVKKPFVYEEVGRDAWYWIPSGKPRRTHMIDAEPVPYFSRDMSAAWAVVERLRERRIGETEMREVFSVAHCYTAEQVAAAICRAALVAIGAAA